MLFGITALQVDTSQGTILLGTFAPKGSGNWSANGSVVTALTGVGPTNSHTTVQEWFTVVNASGTTRYIPAF